jgi:hypothetical protein
MPEFDKLRHLVRYSEELYDPMAGYSMLAAGRERFSC